MSWQLVTITCVCVICFTAIICTTAIVTERAKLRQAMSEVQKRVGPIGTVRNSN